MEGACAVTLQDMDHRAATEGGASPAYLFSRYHYGKTIEFNKSLRKKKDLNVVIWDAHLGIAIIESYSKQNNINSC